MEFDCKCYLLHHGVMEEMFITKELLESLGFLLTEEQLQDYLEKNKHHYLLLEFYCNKLGLPHKGEENFLSPTSYSEYLNGILCEYGNITFTVINHESEDNMVFSLKAKSRYNQSNQTVLIHVPYRLEEIEDSAKEYLNELQAELQILENVYIYSQKQKRNGKYKKGKEYSLEEFYSKLNHEKRKIR